MRRLARLIGLLITAEGVVGLVTPEAFVSTVRYFQTPPVIYVAAVIRVAVGLVLIRASPTSRAATLLRVLGVLIVLGGLLTPFIGTWAAHVILERWATGGPGVVRIWALVAGAIGGVVLYATGPTQRAA